LNFSELHNYTRKSIGNAIGNRLAKIGLIGKIFGKIPYRLPLPSVPITDKKQLNGIGITDNRYR
jgi:hypothetical protein